MGRIEMSKVFFGARQARYTGAGALDKVGRSGILVLYTYLDAADECILVFHVDEGPGVSWVRHSRSRFEIAGGRLSAKSLRSGTEKLYLIGDAVEAGPGVFERGKLDLGKVPDKWAELFVNVYNEHAWSGDSVLDLPS